MKVQSCLKLFQFDWNWSNQSKIAQILNSTKIELLYKLPVTIQRKISEIKTIWRENHHRVELGSDTEDEQDFDLQGYVDFPNDRRKNGLSRLLEVFPGTQILQSIWFCKKRCIFFDCELVSQSYKPLFFHRHLSIPIRKWTFISIFKLDFLSKGPIVNFRYFHDLFF